MLQSNYDDAFRIDWTVDPHDLTVLISIAALTSIAFSTLALSFMIIFAELLIKMSLFFNILLFAAGAGLSIWIGAIGMTVICLVLMGFTLYYTTRVWSRIPFAAANLTTAVTAVKANLGLALYAYGSIIFIFLWTLWWAVATSSTFYVLNGCNAKGQCFTEPNGGLVFLFLLSYYWTAQIIANIVHVTTAGVVGTWWYIPKEATGCFSRAISDSYCRAITFNFGSICFASLIVAIIQTLREMVNAVRENGDAFLACFADCILACIETLAEIFNRFALVYCAVHGQSFLQGGRSVMQLFQQRGWTTIITDMMVDTVLFMVAVGVALTVGILSVIVGTAMGMQRTGTLGVAFLAGSFLGYSMCAVLFALVSSAVNAVIVCYAEAPNEFQANHPDLSNRMKHAWRQAWPGEFTY